MLLTVRFIKCIVEMGVFAFDASIGQMVRSIQKTRCQLQIRTGSSVLRSVEDNTLEQYRAQIGKSTRRAFIDKDPGRHSDKCLLAKPKPMDQKD